MNIHIPEAAVVQCLNATDHMNSLQEGLRSLFRSLRRDLNTQTTGALYTALVGARARDLSLSGERCYSPRHGSRVIAEIGLSYRSLTGAAQGT